MELKDIARNIRQFLYVRFSLHKDIEDENDIVESIRKGVEFRGISTWILIFAILLAAIGLNVNSTAVIIGAMLISPLMGPIMGVGLGLSIFDFELLKSAGKNLTIMVAISLFTSATYFSLSPLHEAQSELLSRTTPTIWDVLIALFGGLAGIVAGTSKGKGTVLPGVAIATALMPPLCTAGYGLANGDFFFFLGAFYLFCINAVFISLSTLVVTRLLKYQPVVLPDKPRERRLRNIISLVVIITIIPSILIAYLTVQQELFEQRARQYLEKEFDISGTFVLTSRPDFANSTMDIMLAGRTLPEDSIDLLIEKRIEYELEDIQVRINQGSDFTDNINLEEFKTGLTREIYVENNRVIQDQLETISKLTDEVKKLKQTYPVSDIANELTALNSGVLKLSIHDNEIYDITTKVRDTVTLAYIEFDRIPPKSETEKIQRWMKTRLHTDSLLMISRLR